LVEDGGRVTIVDTGVPAYYAQLDRGLEALGRGRGDVDAIVLTHGPSDHIGFAEQARGELGVPVYVHRDDENLTTTGKAFGKREAPMLPYLRYPQAWKLLAHFSTAAAEARARGAHIRRRRHARRSRTAARDPHAGTHGRTRRLPFRVAGRARARRPAVHAEPAHRPARPSAPAARAQQLERHDARLALEDRGSRRGGARVRPRRAVDRRRRRRGPARTRSRPHVGGGPPRRRRPAPALRRRRRGRAGAAAARRADVVLPLAE